MADSIPKCPFEVLNDIVCAEFIQDKILVHRPDISKIEDQPGRFMVIAVGPGLPRDAKDPNSEMVRPNFEPGEYILLQTQNAYMFQDSGRLPGRFFAMIRGGMILAKWNDLTPPADTLQKILSTP
jgi:hypothetical protein